MGLSPSCLNGVAERWRILELRDLIRQADLRITEFMLLTLNDQDHNSPAWAQFRAWSEYSRRLQDEEWALCVEAAASASIAAAIPRTPRWDLRLKADASSGSSSRKAPLVREGEKCNQASLRSHSSHTSPDSSRSLKGFPGGSSIGSVEFLDGLLQPDKLATGSQDDKEPLLPGLPALGRGDVGEPLLAGPFTSGVRKRFHRGQQQQESCQQSWRVMMPYDTCPLTATSLAQEEVAARPGTRAARLPAACTTHQASSRAPGRQLATHLHQILRARLLPLLVNSIVDLVTRPLPPP
ncbi:hypothetical protein ACK3TF_002983 [Chlorella vulgaris]